MPEVIINGAEGRLEGRYSPAKSDRAPVAVLLHPHPQYGGTMHNKVVFTLNQCFLQAGFATLRFNFRGVGRSQGSFARGEGELTDAASALDWIQTYNANASACWIAGFSFGAWISLQLLMRRPEIEGFLAISPPANMYDFGFLSPCPAHGLITQGDRDDIVNEAAVSTLVDKLRAQKGTNVEYKLIPGADHYYRTQMDALTHATDEFIARRMVEFKTRPRLRSDRKRRQLPVDVPQ